MKKKKFITFLAMASVSIGMLGAPLAAYAEPLSGDAFSDKPGDVYIGDATTPSANVGDTSTDVYVSTAGSPKKITYSVEVNFGTMKFTYDYGLSWDSTTHTYAAVDGRSIKEGWDIRDFNDDNNSITIINHSNYPVAADIVYRPGTNNPFNNAPTSTNSVIGIFSNSNTNFTENVLKEGYKPTQEAIGASNVENNPKTVYKEVKQNLDIDFNDDLAEQVSEGAFYGRLKEAVAGKGKHYATYYFAFSGKPDDGKTFKDKKAGAIKVTVTPITDTSKVETPRF